MRLAVIGSMGAGLHTCNADHSNSRLGAMTPLILACSGPGAMRLIQDNILYAQQHAMVVGCLAVLSVTLWVFLRRFKALPICVLLLLLVHPAWTISAIRGDCGYFKAGAATLDTVVSTICVGLQTVAWLWPSLRRKASHQPQLTGDDRDGQ